MKCIIASDPLWDPGLVARVARRSGAHCLLVTSSSELSSMLDSESGIDFIFFPHWSHRIHQNIYEKFQCIIFHMTDLPFGRGGSPLQNLVSRGIYETVVTSFRCVEEMDAGPIYAKTPLSLHGSAQEIYLRAQDVIEDQMVTILTKPLVPEPQLGESTQFKRRRPEDSDITRVGTLRELFDVIRMLDAEGYPHAFLVAGQFRFEFRRGSFYGDSVIAEVTITNDDRKADADEQ